MFIDWNVTKYHAPFGGAEIKVDLYSPCDIPLLRTAPVGMVSAAINISPLTG